MCALVLASALAGFTLQDIPNLPDGAPMPDQFEGSWAVADLVLEDGSAGTDGIPDLVVYGLAPAPLDPNDRFLSIVPGPIGTNTVEPQLFAVLSPIGTTALVTRGLFVGDVDNDGDADIVHVSPYRVHLWRAPFTAGLEQIQVQGSANPYSLEGAGLVDWNANGYLDLVLAENEQLTYVPNDAGDLTADGLLLHQLGAGASSDYLALGDPDGDGNPDVLWRTTEGVIALERGGLPVTDISLTSYDNAFRKQGVMWCDLGYVDGVLTSLWNGGPVGDGNSYRNFGWSAGSLVPLQGGRGLGGACGDFANTGSLQALWGTSSSLVVLTPPDMYDNLFSVTPDDNDRRVFVPADFDGDGDLDVVIVGGSATTAVAKLAVNDANTGSLQIQVRRDLGGMTRSDIGASVETAGRRQTLSGGQGHGTTAWEWLHFGVPVTADASRALLVTFGDGTTENVTVPLTGRLEITNLDVDGDGLADLCDPCPHVHVDV
ncbi:MAG: VCBS repeat-containing protein, partial [Myxococcales bacterium]|nr:VCBS repeat-containing protein [Myxococcales bacterium]